ncbi:MAG TPA: NTP transferase domain-containing protein, partial [Treponemataceae bacterium]|nr:NTP transferase domain-containing protein [Treponemataceae bacterium]
MRCVILQARLDSTRLPRKAVLPLGGKPVIYRVMENLRRVVADQYVLACDEASEAELAPIARECGFLCIAGPKEDVLTRFCVVVKKVGADVVLRATGDNPWLFADAAQRTLDRFVELSATDNPPDYFTFTGLPHGCGVEAFSARRLLEACVLTDSSYDHEHVGPAFYRHPERFTSVFETAGDAWYHPEIRTTIDTREDYERACLMNEYLRSSGKAVPTDSASVIDAWRYVSRPVLFVPHAEPGGGTGHIRRLSALVAELSRSWRCILYIPLHSPFMGCVPKDALPFVSHVLPESAYLVVLDRFRTTVAEMADFRKIGPVVALDEGGSSRHIADYLLDVIPSLPLSPCAPNLADVAYLPLPLRRREKTVSSVSSALVVAGGENAVGYALPVAEILSSMDLEVTVIDPSATGLSKHEKGYTVSGPVQGLRERLCHYDLVVTHYGFTAFEALAAGSRVMLFSPTQYHYKLGLKAGFSSLPCGKPESAAFRRMLARGIKVPGFITPASPQKRLSDAIGSLLTRKSLECPLCGKSQATVIARSLDRTVSRCEHCGMAYLLFIVAPSKGYDKSYFFEE